MEEEMISSSTWISDTNWNVIHGALDNSISFETPISVIEEELITPTDQLQLVKPPSDSVPCEITISFKQRHEIRQVYVRSTARVYEIYYAADQQSSNEYLCTVRCCTAAKGDTSLQESDPEEAIVANQEGTIETVEHLADKTKNDRSNGTGEDGWVEVKVPDSMADKNNGSTARSIQDFYEATAEISDANPCISLTLRLLSLQTQACAQVEEIYIFAEPVDSEDQVGPTENSAGSSLMAMLVPTLLNLSKTGNSRTQERHVSDIRERSNYHNDKSNGTESLKSTMGMTKQQEGNANMPDGATKVEEVTRESADSTHSQSSKQVPSTGQGPEFVTKETDLPFGRIEKVLDHLVCRVVRLEAFCLRFEENMLKPISNIETKLQGLEKQLELLTMRSQPSEFYPSTRITAPEFSCTESQSNSLYNDGNDGNCHRCKDARYTRITAPEFVCTESESNSFHHEGIDDQKDIYVAESTFPIDDAPHPAVPRSCPGLVVTAPEFSNDDDDECDDNREGDGDEKKCSEVPVLYHKGSSRDKPSLSIDDALASALAGFLTMASVQPPGLTETSELITPEIPSEENGDNHKLKSPSAIPSEQDPETGSSCVGSNRKENVNDSDVASCCSSQGNEPQVKSPSAIPSEQDPETGSSCVGSNRKENVNDSGVASCCSSQGNEPQVTKLTNEIPAETDNALGLGQGEFQELKGNCGNTSINQTGSQTSSSILISNGTVIDEQWFATPTDESGTGTEKITQLEVQHFIEQNNDKTADDISEACLDLTTKETQGAEDSKNSSECVLERTYSSTVDFELPILDVKFVPHENWKAGSSLEFLLDDMPETKIEDFYVKDENNSAASAEFLHADNPETNLEDFCVKDKDNGVASVEQREQFSSEDKGFDFSNLDEQLLAGIDNLTVESESIQESLTCANQVEFLSLI